MSRDSKQVKKVKKKKKRKRQKLDKQAAELFRERGERHIDSLFSSLWKLGVCRKPIREWKLR